jgi:hypothetical protein
MAKLHAEIGAKHPYAANRLLEIVRKMYNLGRKWGLVPIDKASPASGVDRFPETKRRRFVTPDELLQLSKRSTRRLMNTFGMPFGFCCSRDSVAESCSRPSGATLIGSNVHY